MVSVTTLEDAPAALRVRNIFLIVLEVYSTELDKVELQIREKAAQGPDFFGGAPLLLDVSRLRAEIGADWLQEVAHKALACGFIPVGVTGAAPALADAARQHGIAVWPNKREHRAEPLEVQETAPQPEAETRSDDSGNDRAQTTMVINRPVRSGQRVYAKGRDLIVLSSVNTGAEIMADGHIHVYGTLRGRALAGVAGQEEARIFCHDLKAELVAVAGYYLTYEDLPADRRDTAVQISLSGESLNIEPLKQ